MSILSKIPPIIIALACIPLARFFLDLSKGLDYLLYHYLIDDAFLYFEISRHIPEFNKGIPTSGFHPLYAFLISPLHSLLDYWYAIPLSLLILVLANSICVILIYRLLSHYFPNPIPILCASAWTVNGQIYRLSMMGVEIMLAVMFVLLFIELFVRIQKKGFEKNRVNDSCQLGLFFGLAFLARMDSPLITTPFILYVLYKHVRAPRKLCLIIASTILLPTVWMCNIYANTGSLTPTSSAALRVLRGLDDTPILQIESILYQARYLRAGTVDLIIDVHWSSRPLFFNICLLLSMLGLNAYYKEKKKKHFRQIIQFILLLTTGFILWSSYYLLYLRGFRPWYFGYLGVIAYILFLPLIFTLLFSFRPLSKTLLMVAVFIIVLLGVYSQPTIIAIQEYDKYMSALAANTIIEDRGIEGNIGSFNSGIYNYFMHEDVINLDGVVNPEAVEAIRYDRLPEYVKKRNITYLIDHDVREAANLDLLYNDDRVMLERWIDLTEYYPGYREKYGYGYNYFKRTYLWKITVD